MKSWWASASGCGFHDAEDASEPRTRATLRNASRIREVIALAVQTHGQKRGVHRAAELLGVAERTVRDIQGGRTSGASIAEETARDAAHALRRERQAQLRAELREIEGQMNAMDVARGGASFGVGG